MLSTSTCRTTHTPEQRTGRSAEAPASNGWGFIVVSIQSLYFSVQPRFATHASHPSGYGVRERFVEGPAGSHGYLRENPIEPIRFPSFQYCPLT